MYDKARMHLQRGVRDTWRNQSDVHRLAGNLAKKSMPFLDRAYAMHVLTVKRQEECE